VAGAGTKLSLSFPKGQKDVLPADW